MKINKLWVEWNLLLLEENKIKKIWIIWCWAHLYRNILPALRFVEWHEIIATCDLNIEKAKLFAKANWATYYYSNYIEMINNHEFDYIIIVVWYDIVTWKPLYPTIAKHILSKWINTWMEKPPTDNSKELENLKNIANQNNCFFQVWFKMMFAPALNEIKNMLLRKNFNSVQSFYVTYAVDMPDDIRDLTIPWNRRFLDDIVHVFSQIHYLFWKPNKMKYFKSWKNDWFIILKYLNWFYWTIHVQWWIWIIWPAEYLRIIWEWSFIELIWWTKLMYHNYWDPWSYWRDISYFRADNTFSELYSPELRQPLWALSLHSESMFWYINQFNYLINNQNGEWTAWMKDSIDIMRLYDWLWDEEDVWHYLNSSNVRYTKKDILTKNLYHTCSFCNNIMSIKDGWTYSCQTCWKTIQLIDNEVLLFSNNYDKIIKILEKFWEIKSLSFTNSSINKKNYERIYIDFILKNKKELWWKFSINNNNLFLNEFNFNNIINKSQFLMPKILYSSDFYLIFEKINWDILNEIIISNINNIFDEDSFLNKLLFNIIEKLSVFHRDNPWIIHNDFDQYNIIVWENINSIYLIDWEFSNQSDNQYFDLLNFLFILIFSYYKNYDKNNVLDEFKNNIVFIKLFKTLINKYNMWNNTINILYIWILIKKYASYKMNEIDKQWRDQNNFIYKFVYDYDFSFLLN